VSTAAVFGGSFNPPHLAHVLAVLTVLETHDVDEVLVVPSFRHPFDKQLAGYEHRLEMCRLAMAPLGPRARVSTIERDRDGGDGQPSRTLDTLEALAREQPARRLRLVIGADILGERHKWYRWPDIETLAPPIVLGRQGVPMPEGLPPVVTLPAVSSTEVRARLAAGEPVDHLVPRAVVAYLRAHALYRA
jgi:nicotinate-nucleotide adenylyltransferase